MQHFSKAPDILQNLKVRTADLHIRVEQSLQIFSPAFDLQAYTHLLARFYGFWSPLEAQLCKLQELKYSAVDLHARLKAHLLAADLRVLGADPAMLPYYDRNLDVQTFLKGLGCMYVLEGSTLGAQFIARHLRERFQIGESSGGSFFNAYGAEVGKRWSDFRTFLTLHSRTGPHEEIITAARDTFEALDGWLRSAWVIEPAVPERGLEVNPETTFRVSLS